VPILAVETEGAASFHAATLAGRPVPLDRIDSIATSLGARQVCEQAVRWWRERPVRSVLVSDTSALQACEQFLADHRVLVEPACGAALAAVYGAQHAAELAGFGQVLVIVCGGATATLAQIQAWRMALSLAPTP
jgi:L-serine/L-threonine ammonia-lyase